MTKPPKGAGDLEEARRRAGIVRTSPMRKSGMAMSSSEKDRLTDLASQRQQNVMANRQALMRRQAQTLARSKMTPEEARADKQLLRGTGGATRAATNAARVAAGRPELSKAGYSYRQDIAASRRLAKKPTTAAPAPTLTPTTDTGTPAVVKLSKGGVVPGKRK